MMVDTKVALATCNATITAADAVNVTVSHSKAASRDTSLEQNPRVALCRMLAKLELYGL